MEKTALRCPSCHTGLSAHKTGDNQPITCPRCQFRGILSQFPEITLKKIVCPSCRTVLSVDPLKTGLIVCPHCKQGRDASAYPEAQQLDSMSTNLPGSAGNTLARPGILTWVKGDSPVY
ncbi:MAG: hypothetical protein LBP98_07740, partial [Tannerella sp.]|nr:hypothetical protein [Tannerella sp.]